MFKKILVAEDMDDINRGVYDTLCKLGILEIQQVQYCDDAYLKIKRAILDKKPFDLLITDLSFENDYREQKYESGEALVKALKQENIEIPIIMYSVEDRLEKVRLLINKYDINAYACKGRDGLKELSKAIHHISTKKEKYLSPQVILAKSTNNDTDINDYDIELIELLAKGLSQSEISTFFTKNKISPSSLSSVEKRINKLKDIFRANNPAHLIAIAKDQGFI